jgi:uncharacterized repeat protein (TIGR02543 family)
MQAPDAGQAEATLKISPDAVLNVSGQSENTGQTDIPTEKQQRGKRKRPLIAVLVFSFLALLLGLSLLLNAINSPKDALKETAQQQDRNPSSDGTPPRSSQDPDDDHENGDGDDAIQDEEVNGQEDGSDDQTNEGNEQGDPNNPDNPTPVQYTVTYNFKDNGGTSATRTTARLTAGTPVDLSPTAAKANWQFIGWNTNKGATAGMAPYNMPPADVILYAIFRPIPVANNLSYNLSHSQLSSSGRNYTDNLMKNDVNTQGCVIGKVRVGTREITMTSGGIYSLWRQGTCNSGGACSGSDTHRAGLNQNGLLDLTNNLCNGYKLTFQYQLRSPDGIDSNWATVTITVND